MTTHLNETFSPSGVRSSTSRVASVLPFYNSAIHTEQSEQTGRPEQGFELQEVRRPRSDHSRENLQESPDRKVDQGPSFHLPEDSQHLLSHPSDSDYDSDELMTRKSNRSKSRQPNGSSSTASNGQNGHVNGDMNNHIEMRRKDVVMDSPTQTAHLMSREGFTLDDEPPPTPHSLSANTSFFQLPIQDRRNFLLLVLLYFLQGIPMGLAAGSVPFLLKSHLSYGQIGIFTLAAYPYSLKLLWSPIVDAVWSSKVGRRKSWILPIQLCSGFGMLYMGSRATEMMVVAGAEDGSGVWTFTWWWFFLVFLCATQDIAVDGIVHPYRIHGQANVITRLGFDLVVYSKSVLRIHSTDRGFNGWTIPV